MHSLEALGETIRAALEQVDVLVTSGGVSMGEKVRAAFLVNF